MYKKRISIALSFLLLFVFSCIGQENTPAVKWSFSSSVQGNEGEIVFKAKIGKGWHMYSQLVVPDGPIPTSFKFDSTSKAYEKIGLTQESTPIKHFEQVFNAELQFFADSATFTQKIKILSSDTFSVKGELEYMVCNDHECMPPEVVEFNVKVNPGSINAISGDEQKSSTEESSSLWGIIILSFLGGFAALITPCVFPMIPLTVSFFTKQSKTRKQGIFNAMFFGVSIITIYVSLGLIITWIWGGDALNAISSNEWMNLFFFIIFVVFGASFLGAFELTLPSSWVNKADQASDKGGLIGIFFMAFTLALVSFSCTGPIVGLILGEASTSGNYLSLTFGMFAFSLALALPFVLFALFPTWLNSLPKSGGWLNNVKVFLGIIEIGFALKFLSVTDLQGLHIDWLDFHIDGPLGLLKREYFIAIWVVLSIILGIYMLGKLKFPHDSEVSHVSIPKFFIALICFSFAAYLFPGMWGAPLKLISGFSPPSFYTEGNWINTQPEQSNSNNNHLLGDTSGTTKHSTSNHKCPHNLNCYHDFEEALLEAKRVNKPLMVDFTGWACVNCRKMEENVWSDPEVLSRLKNDYVLVSLYVDERTKLENPYVSEKTKKKIKTVGNKWSEFQVTHFGRNSQPWYELLDHNKNRLTSEGRGYDPNIPEFAKFLDQGKSEFNKRK